VVDRSPTLRQTAYWVPTRVSGERSFSMLVEFSLNQRPEGTRHSIAEVAWSTGSIDEALSIVPPFVPEKTRKEMRRLLQPWPGGRYTDACQRSGGILNLFTPPWDERQDEAWAEMLAGWEAETFADDDARQEALRALEQRWNVTPHPFFAGLTPAQVMVGGGPRENELAREFLERLTDMFDGHPFESEGQSLIKTLMLLRGWECQPGKDGQTPRDVIVAERDELLARRARALSGSAPG
jgi:hypothetical protein